MLGYDEFHHDLIERYTKLFGSLFTKLEVYRENLTDPTKPNRQKVPIAYSPRDKVLAFAEINYGSDETAVATISPRIGFQRVGIQRNNTAQTNKFQKIQLSTGTTRNYQPYNIMFELYVVGKTENDCQRVVEQILPFFTPSISITIYPFPGEEFTRDVTITLNQISEEDRYQGEAQDRRIVTWTLGFTMQAYIFGPITTTSSEIKKVIVNYGDLNTMDLLETSEVWPGLTAGGEPTTDPDEAIDYKEVEKTDPYAIITVFEHE